MNTVLFIHNDGAENGAILKKYLTKNFIGINIQTYNTIEGFNEKLRQLSLYSINEIFILLIDSIASLNELTALTDLLKDKRLILILPENSKSTILQAQQFCPNYFTYMGNTYDDICDVLNKMIKQTTTNNKRALGW